MESELPITESTTAAAVHAANKRDTFLRVVDLVQAHRRSILRSVVVGTLIATVIAFALPRRYTAEVRILPPEKQSSTAMLAALAGGKIPAAMSELAGSVLGAKDPGALVQNLATSNSVSDALIRKFELQRHYSKRYLVDTRKKLRSRIKIAEDRKSGALVIEVTDGDKALARDMANSLVEELDSTFTRVSTSSARQERVFLEKRLALAKSDLAAAEKSFSVFASTNSTLDISEQTKAMVGASADLQAQIIAGESQLESLRQIYSEDNYRVRSTSARVGELKRHMANISGASGATEVSGYPTVKRLPILGTEWAEKYRTVKVQQGLFELLTQQLELAKVQEAREVPTIKVVDRAEIPEKKSWPPRAIIIMLGLFLSLAGAIAYFWAIDWWNTLPSDDIYKLRARMAGAVLFSRGGAKTTFLREG